MAKELIGSREPQLQLVFHNEAKIWVFFLRHGDQLIESITAADAYKAIEWPGSFEEFIETWLFQQDYPYQSPQNDASHFKRRVSHNRKPEDDSHIKYE